MIDYSTLIKIYNSYLFLFRRKEKKPKEKLFKVTIEGAENSLIAVAIKNYLSSFRFSILFPPEKDGKQHR